MPVLRVLVDEQSANFVAAVGAAAAVDGEGSRVGVAAVADADAATCGGGDPCLRNPDIQVAEMCGLVIAKEEYVATGRTRICQSEVMIIASEMGELNSAGFPRDVSW